MKTTVTLNAFMRIGSSVINTTALYQNPTENAQYLTFSATDMSDCGYSLVGQAEITLTLIEQNQAINKEIDALQAEQAAIRAEATRRETQIQSRINDLLALSFTPAGEASSRPVDPADDFLIY